MRGRGFVGGVLGLTIALLALPPRPAAGAELVLDGLSFFFFEGAGVGESLPAGVTLPVTLEQSGPATWKMSGAAGSELPPVAYLQIPPIHTVDRQVRCWLRSVSPRLISPLQIRFTVSQAATSRSDRGAKTLCLTDFGEGLT